jgi:hypothetical protein
MAELPKAPPRGMPSGQTSMLEPRANDLLAIHPACSGNRHDQPYRPFHKRKLGDQTRDDVDKEPREERSCGRSQTSLYNATRPHQALGDRTPMAVWCEGVTAVDMTLRLDNAVALPTCPHAHSRNNSSRQRGSQRDIRRSERDERNGQDNMS